MGVKIRHRETGEERTLLNGEYATFASEHRDEVNEFWQVVETDAILPYEQSEKYMQELRREIDALERRNRTLAREIEKYGIKMNELCEDIIEAVYPPSVDLDFPAGDDTALRMIRAAITIRARSGGTLDNAIKSAVEILDGKVRDPISSEDDEYDDEDDY